MNKAMICLSDMGVRGKKNGAEPIIEGSIRKKDKSNAHRELCLLAGKWLRRNRFRPPTCHYVAVELVTANQETPDVFGWNYWTSVLIEVKVSRSDFLADKKKPFRLFPEDGLGEYRYYCCPKGLINPEEVPQHWGLIYEEDGTIRVIKEAERQPANYRAEMTICTSIMRREGIKYKLFNYRYEEV